MQSDCDAIPSRDVDRDHTRNCKTTRCSNSDLSFVNRTMHHGAECQLEGPRVQRTRKRLCSSRARHVASHHFKLFTRPCTRVFTPVVAVARRRPPLRQPQAVLPLAPAVHVACRHQPPRRRATPAAAPDHPARQCRATVALPLLRLRLQPLPRHLHRRRCHCQQPWARVPSWTLTLLGRSRHRQLRSRRCPARQARLAARRRRRLCPNHL